MSSMNTLLNRYQRRKDPAPNKVAPGRVKPVHLDTRGDVYTKFRNNHVHTCRTVKCQTGEVSTIGILFIIINKFPHEKIWRKWLEQSSIDAARIKILIHAKNPEQVTSEWVRMRLVRSFQYKPEWGSMDLTRVMIGLMKEMESTGEGADKVIFASESCLPIVPVHAFVQALTRDHDSWVNYSDQAKNGYANQKQWDPLLAKGFPADCIYKGDQWNALSRAHVREILSCPRELYGLSAAPGIGAAVAPVETVTEASKVAETCLSGTLNSSAELNLTAPAPAPVIAVSSVPLGEVFHDNMAENMLLDRLFNRVDATDEMYIPTCLRLTGHLQTLTNNKIVKQLGTGTDSNNGPCCAAGTSVMLCGSAVKRRSCTFVQWYTGDKISVHPQSYSQLNADILIDARLCNHPLLNDCGSHNSTRRSNLHYQRLKAEHMADLSNYRHSALFIRKIKTETDEEEQQLYADWFDLIITRGQQPPVLPVLATAISESTVALCAQSVHASVPAHVVTYFKDTGTNAVVAGGGKQCEPAIANECDSDIVIGGDGGGGSDFDGNEPFTKKRKIL